MNAALKPDAFQDEFKGVLNTPSGAENNVVTRKGIERGYCLVPGYSTHIPIFIRR